MNLVTSKVVLKLVMVETTLQICSCAQQVGATLTSHTGIERQGLRLNWSLISCG